MTKGKFIVIDGLDGSGKKTQLDSLVKYCHKHKIKVATIDFPQYDKTFFGKLVARYLRGEFGSLEETNPYLAGLTYAGDRFQGKPIMDRALKSGKLLISNRYTSSSMAFMSAKFANIKDQDNYISWLRQLEQKIYGCPQEDLLIYLSVPPTLGQKLVLNKGKRKYLNNKNQHDLHEENLNYLKRVEQVYLKMVKRFPGWVKIDCLDEKGNLKSKQEIHTLIIKLLKDKKIIP